MTERYLGSIISSTPVEPSGSLSTATASGVWHLHDPLLFGQADDWPNAANRPSIAHYGASGDSGDAVMNKVEKVTIDTTGNFTDFNDLTEAKFDAGSNGSPTRTIFFGGYSGNIAQPNSTRIKIEYFDNTTTGNAVNFGDLSSQRRYPSGNINNNVRGIVAGGEGGFGDVNRRNIIEYVTMASTGDAVDFGDLTGATKQNSSTSSSTRGLSAGGSRSSGDVNVIDFITIASAGNATDFGDLGDPRDTQAALASSTRAVFSGDRQASASNQIEYVTIASTGNATDFGDLTTTAYQHSGAESSTRGIFIGGVRAGSISNIVDFITIGSTGNATDFGDLTEARYHGTASSSGKSSVQNESYFTPAAMSLIHHGTLVSGPGKTGVSYIDIATTGRLAMFGDVSGPSSYVISGGAASTTRGVLAGIHTASGSNGDDLEFFTFSTKGKSTDFGDATQNLYGSMGSSSTRGVMQVGYDGGASYTVNIIEYITIASAGDTTDFGDLTEGGSRSAPAGSTTRLLFMGRDAYGTGTQNGSTTVDYVTIASTGNATDFGDLSTAVHYAAGVSSNTRAVKCGGWSNSNTTAVNEMDYFTIASTGNATDFGDLTVARGGMVGCSSKIRGVLGTGANATGGTTDVLDYITIASTGNATDWGDWYATHSLNRYSVGSASNSHGGLS
tara:strand:+ start:240 stop:2252 length:2013 start_codon:yes stop_codon:yes gene_type:complete